MNSATLSQNSRTGGKSHHKYMVMDTILRNEQNVRSEETMKINVQKKENRMWITEIKHQRNGRSMVQQKERKKENDNNKKQL